jgi:pilus assembly protein CpaE
MKIVVLSAEPAASRALAEPLTRAGVPGRVVVERRARLGEIGAVADQEGPDVMVLDRLCQTVEDLKSLEAPLQRHPALGYILIAERAVPELLVRAMQLGVKDVLAPAVSEAELDGAVQRVERAHGRHGGSQNAAAVVAFLACKGGAGATFIAANTAYLLASEYGRRTLLVDLDLGSADAALFVASQSSAATMADLARDVARLDSSLLAASVIRVLPNFDVLEAPESLEGVMDVTAERVETILKLAESQYDSIVLNVGRAFDGVTVRALDRSQLIFPVLQLTVPFIRDTKRLLATLQALDIDAGRVHLIVNRFESDADIRLVDVEHTLGHKAALTVPNCFKLVSASVNQGIPVAALDARAPVTRRLRALIEQFLGGEPRARNGWFTSLLRSA